MCSGELHSVRVYCFSIWVWSFHLSIVFSFGYGLLLWVLSFHLGMIFSFGYGLS